MKKKNNLIKSIEQIRSKNNKNWMDLLRLSLKLDFESTSKILKEICKDDQRIMIKKFLNCLKNWENK